MDATNVIKSRIAEREADIKNLTEQIQRSEQFLSALRVQHIHAQGKLAELSSLLSAIESPAASSPLAGLLSLVGKETAKFAASVTLPTVEDLDRHVAENPGADV